MPALPNELYKKFTADYGLSDHDALLIIEQKDIALYYEEIIKIHQNYKAAANWLMGNIKSYLNQKALEISSFKISSKNIGLLIKMIDNNEIFPIL